jgi:murein DD-endopeptidase MepM/ murein hydrolase activator NlpD
MTTKPTSRLPLTRPGIAGADDDVLVVADNRFSAASDYEDADDEKDDSLLSKAILARFFETPEMDSMQPEAEEEVDVEAKFFVYRNEQTGDQIRVSEAAAADPAFIDELTRRGYSSVTGDIPIDPGAGGPIEFRRDGGGLTLDRPVDRGRVTDDFHLRDRHPVTGRRHAAHRGTDIGVGIGTPLEASADGVVAYSGTSQGYGNVVVIYHGNGVFTMQAHLNDRDVVTGQRVRRGQHIGESGDTGIGTGAHLHSEVWLADSRGVVHTVDPEVVWRGADLSDPRTRASLIANAEGTLRGQDEARVLGRTGMSSGQLAADVRALAAPAPAMT